MLDPPSSQQRPPWNLRGRSVQLRDPVLDREFDEVGKIRDTQLVHHSAAIRIDGLGGQKQHRADFGARLSVRNQLQNLALSPAQAAAPGNAYIQKNLVSDQPGMAQVTDPNLVNPWGLSASATCLSG